MTYHILIVDDEPIVRQGLMSFNWAKFGFEAINSCENGREALAWLNHHQVDVVLSDIKMPGIDGVELSRQIKELYPDILVILLTGYNEFSYAQQAIKSGVFDYLLKPAEDEDFEKVLTKSYQKLADRAQEKKLQDVMMYNYMLRNEMNDYSISDEAMKSYQPIFHSSEPYRICLFYANSETIEAQPYNHLASLGFVQITRREWITRIPDHKLEFLSDALQDLGGNIGISSLKTNKDEVPSAFQEAHQALQKKFLYPDEHMFHYTEDADESSALLDMSEILKKIILLINRLHGLNPKMMEVQFVEILQEIRAKEFSNSYIKQLLFYMISALETEFTKMPLFIREDWMLRKNHFLHIVNTADRLEQIEQSLLSDIYGFIQETKSTNMVIKESAKLDQVLQYIHGHYHDILSLDLLAEFCDMHPNTFSKWFKEYKGINFIDYVTRYRIDKSRELLEQTDLKTSEIANAVGFQDPRYYGQVFKKMVDFTPTEYRTLFK